jgi:hypothetical protein
MPGSSGCIDIGNAGFERLVALLSGYRGMVRVRVDYRGHAAPEVGALERAAGRFTYPETQGAEPTVWDRFRSLLEICSTAPCGLRSESDAPEARLGRR